MKKMTKTLAVLLALVIIAPSVKAQSLPRQRQLYQNGFYSKAFRELEGYAGPDAEGLRTLCLLQLRTDGAYSRAASFIKTYHESALAEEVKLLWGLCLFDDASYGQALEVLGSISPKAVPASKEQEYLYKLGYSAYSSGDWEGAGEILTRVAGQESDYAAPAAFSLGYMKYARGNFHEAEKWFSRCRKDHRFSSEAAYYILECRFNEKDYSYVTREGVPLFEELPSGRRPRLGTILSESFLVLGDVQKARDYLRESYGDSENMTRSDYYRAGEIAYLSEDWQGAVENFSRMGSSRDSLGQVAAYQLGYSYIRLHNKVAAMGSFKEAAALPYDSEIGKDAFYNYAKLAFDLGKDTAPFGEYMQKYRERNDEIYSYMAMAALVSHDYGAAVKAYDNIEELTPLMKSNYMKACLLSARELMEKGSWRLAVPLLRSAAFYSPKRDGFNQLCRYYLAEALYRDGKYEEARKELTDLDNLQALRRSPEGKLIPYQLGYTCFKLADYEKALSWFTKYLAGADTELGADASTRVADCHFFGGNYSAALEAYLKQISSYPSSGSLYSRYRAGLSSGLLGDNRRKATILEPVTASSPDTPYYSESLYELGRAYVANGQGEKAAGIFGTLSENTKDPSLQAQALMELGMIARNAGKSSEALEYYKRVVSSSPEWADDALLAIESIYRTREDPDAYLEYVNSLSGGSLRTDAQKEDVYFSSAEQVFLSGDYDKARTLLESYLEKYSGGAREPKALFYLAECNRISGAPEQAIDLYAKARAGGLDPALSEDALRRIATLCHNTGRYGEALLAWKELEGSARLEDNRKAAAEGAMRSAFRAREWGSAIEWADKVLSSAGDAALVREARYVRAKSLLSSSRREEAFEELKKLSEEPSTAEGAEATYLIIEDLYNRAVFDSIQESVYAFSERAGGQNYWLAKAFIVLGDSFAEQGNAAQARATFESIVSGYTPSGQQDDVLDQVRLRLDKLK